ADQKFDELEEKGKAKIQEMKDKATGKAGEALADLKQTTKDLADKADQKIDSLIDKTKKKPEEPKK
ncbi:MAG TPA: hypothetical protein PKH02_08230, partial [Bacteroidales bacterium]|nr:hypothetical protein [Bacteroidales bacterium]